MKNWLGFTFLGFFQRSQSEKGRGIKFFNVLVSLFLFLLLIPLLLSLGSIFSFSYNLKNEKSLNEAINHMFVENHITYSLNNHKLQSEYLINTFEKEEDKKYKYNEFNLILDTRDQNTTYDDFVFVAKDKSGNEVTYSPKLINDSNFVFTFSYSGKAFSPLERQSTYQEYLELITNPENAEYNKLAKADFDSLNNKKESLSESDFANQLYELYVGYYYPNLQDLGSASQVPILRGYYLKKYISQDTSNNSLLVFDNLIVVNFINRQKQKCVYDGYLSTTKLSITTDASTEANQAKTNINRLLTNLFESGYGLQFTIYFVNIFRLSPFVLGFAIIFPLIDFLIVRKKKQTSYLDNCIIYSSFINIPAIFTSILGLLLTIVLARGVAFSITIYTFFGLVLLRAIIEIIFAIMTPKEIKEENEEAVTE